MTDSRRNDTSSPLFSWLSFSRSTYERQVQMNPVSALLQTETMNTVRRLVTGVTMAAVVLAVIGGTVHTLQQGTSLKASFNMMQSLTGTVSKVNISQNSFSLRYGSSFDSRISALRKSTWTVLLPPGTNLTDSMAENSPCYLVTDLSGSLTGAARASCNTVVKPEKNLFIEYLLLTPSRNEIVAKAIIGEK